MGNNLYINIADYNIDECPFQIFIGGRGVGKTYSALEVIAGVNKRYKAAGKCIWMRRTRDEWEALQDTKTGEGMNPFKPINKDYLLNLGMIATGNGFGEIYNRTGNAEDGYRYEGDKIGYSTALSTVAHMRGIDLSDVSDWFYDEFIPERHVKRMKGECEALLNAYETFNRNREMKGDKPIRLWMLSNSNDIYNPILEYLHLVNIIERMIAKRETDKIIKSRGIAIHLLQASENFVEQKSQTALYKMTEGTQFADMALNNNFAYNDFSLIAFRNIRGYQPLCALDNAYFYKRKGDSEIYVTYAPCDHIPAFSTMQKQDVVRFMRQYGIKFKPYYVANRLIFESYELKEKVLDILL